MRGGPLSGVQVGAAREESATTAANGDDDDVLVIGLRIERRVEESRRLLDRATKELRNLRSDYDALSASLLVVHHATRHPGGAGFAALSQREAQVVALAVAGQNNREIADNLYISGYTVKNHLKNAFRKLGVRSRWELPHLVAEERSSESHFLASTPSLTL